MSLLLLLRPRCGGDTHDGFVKRKPGAYLGVATVKKRKKKNAAEPAIEIPTIELAATPQTTGAALVKVFEPQQPKPTINRRKKHEPLIAGFTDEELITVLDLL